MAPPPTTQGLQSEIRRHKAIEEDLRIDYRILRERMNGKDDWIDILEGERSELEKRRNMLERENGDLERRGPDLERENENLKKKITDLGSVEKDLEQRLNDMRWKYTCAFWIAVIFVVSYLGQMFSGREAMGQAGLRLPSG
ncbi:hypothetical protein M011DRAFT_488615 [Sporormia fimetaria CBS 119925]|uniref:Uncharacterized protein n=1 Tax=Sporormia fimetaria CBS 119925 TaxID=1340428 RepID=A0A6A6V2T7_9PLEO|nr:hypothetical protein M011DRAFT_488615 [Sporormia fimetaria CBS 119925]